MGNQWRQWQRGMLRAKRPALVTTLARQFCTLWSLSMSPNCDTMQQGVAVVKPTGHKGRRQALGLVQVQMCSSNGLVTCLYYCNHNNHGVSIFHAILTSPITKSCSRCRQWSRLRLSHLQWTRPPKNSWGSHQKGLFWHFPDLVPLVCFGCVVWHWRGSSPHQSSLPLSGKQECILHVGSHVGIQHLGENRKQNWACKDRFCGTPFPCRPLHYTSFLYTINVRLLYHITPPTERQLTVW